MARTEVVTLAEPFELFGKRVTEITLKEPTGYQYSTIGEPRIAVMTATGGGYYIEQPEAITKYLEACVEHETKSDVVKHLSLEDAQEVKQRLLGFFEAAGARR